MINHEDIEMIGVSSIITPSQITHASTQTSKLIVAY